MIQVLEILGYLAALLTTISFIPQAWKVFRTKETQNLSLNMFGLFTIGVLCWVIYGISLGEYPLIFANLITFFLAFYILVMKIKHH